MKENSKHFCIELIMILFIISAIVIASSAIYKDKINIDITANTSDVIISMEDKSLNTNTLNKDNNTIEYNFKVKNYIEENNEIKINQVPVEYYIQFTGIEEMVQNKYLTYRIFYTDEEGNDRLLSRTMNDKFNDYYETDNIFENVVQEEHNYKIIIYLNEETSQEYNLELKVDIGYEQITDKDIIEPNAPELIDGMIPTYWNGEHWVVTSKDGEMWYNYDEKKWANIILVSEANKSKYVGAAEGTLIEEGDINSMYVWIPRFVYKINSNYYHQKVISGGATQALVDIHFSRTEAEGGDFWDPTIEINSGTTADDSNGKWTTCPAFEFGDIHLNGLWVAKFQASNLSNTDYSEVSEFFFTPGRTTVTAISIDNMFKRCREMETKTLYGLARASGTLQDDGTYTVDNNGYDIHLTKNSEYSAVAYLTNSVYGHAESEVLLNEMFTTGGSSVYTTIFNTHAKMSSSGNATGIYDLSGNRWEYVCAYMGDGTKASTKIPVVYKALDRYKDIYHIDGTDYTKQESVYNMFQYIKCATIWETSGSGVSSYDTWFEGRSNIGSGNNICLARGTAGTGKIGETTNSSMYSFGYGDGTGDNSKTFRAVIAVGEGL